MSKGHGALHDWLNKYMPKTGICALCELPEFHEDLGKLERSNKTGKLIQSFDNFQWAHRSCHMKYDRKNKIIHEGKTTIRVDVTMRDKLNSLRLVPGEYLNSVLERIVKVYEENKDNE